MSGIRVLFFSGLILTLTSLLLGSQRLGYQRAVLMMQAGGLAMVVALSIRLWRSNNSLSKLDGVGPLNGLYDLEDGYRQN